MFYGRERLWQWVLTASYVHFLSAVATPHVGMRHYRKRLITQETAPKPISEDEREDERGSYEQTKRFVQRMNSYNNVGAEPVMAAPQVLVHRGLARSLRLACHCAVGLRSLCRFGNWVTPGGSEPPAVKRLRLQLSLKSWWDLAVVESRSVDGATGLSAR